MTSEPHGAPPRSETYQGTITRLLTRHNQGEDSAMADAIAVVYEDLQRIASRHLANERRTPTLDTGTIVHEVYLRLAKQDRTQWRDRNHFFAIAVQITRRLLVDRARRRRYAKRGGGKAHSTTLDGKELPNTKRGLDVQALDDALTDLHRHDPSLAQIIEFRFFGGLTNPEIAQIQGVTSMTVIRRWRLARAWLQRYLMQQEVRE